MPGYILFCKSRSGARLLYIELWYPTHTVQYFAWRFYGGNGILEKKNVTWVCIKPFNLMVYTLTKELTREN